MFINCDTMSNSREKKWLIDFVTSHNIIGNLSNLSIYSKYDRTEEVVLGDGTVLTVSHIGSLAFYSPKKFFHLNDILCVLNLHMNLIYVHHFTK